MPGRLIAFGRWLAEDVAAPEDHVAADGAGHEFDDLRVHGQIEEMTAAAHAFAVVALDMRRDELLGTHARVVADQRIERLTHDRGALRRKPKLRYDPAFSLVVV